MKQQIRNCFIKIGSFGIISFVSAALLSCGGGGGVPLDSTSGPFVLGTFGTILNTLPKTNAAPSMPSGISGVTTSAVRTMGAECETVSPTTAVDADSDGIAKEKNYTFDCTDLSTGGYSFSRKGTIKIEDLDDTTAGVFGGLKYTFDISKFHSEEAATGYVFDYTYKGDWNYIYKNGSLVSDSNYEGSIKYDNGGAFQNDYTYAYQWNWSLTPDDQGNPWTTGKTEFSGTFTMNGKYASESHAGVHTQHEGVWVIKYESSDLTYDSTCTKWYKTGTMTIHDGANTMEIEYNCSSAKLYVNGQESDWWNP